jgi:hypothetical protein
MDREGFLETMRRQYIEDIHEAYQASLHEGGGKVDYVQLSGMLSKVMRRASMDGFKQMDFEELVYSTIPLSTGQLQLSMPPQAQIPMKKAA